MNFDPEHPEQEVHKGQQEIESEQVLFADAHPSEAFKIWHDKGSSHDYWKEFDHHYMQWVHIWQGNKETLVHKVKSKQAPKREY